MDLKKEKIKRYLTNFTKQATFTVEGLMNLTINDLFGQAELKGIGKTAISVGLSVFKKNYIKFKYNEETSLAATSQSEPEPGELVEENAGDLSLAEIDFEEVVINAIEKVNKTERNQIKSKAKQSEVTQKPVSKKLANVLVDKDTFHSSDIQIIKELIQQFQSGRSSLLVQPKTPELTELKQALNFLGIDYKIIRELYRKSV